MHGGFTQTTTQTHAIIDNSACVCTRYCTRCFTTSVVCAVCFCVFLKRVLVISYVRSEFLVWVLVLLLCMAQLYHPS